jgi:hypothetical protein
MFPAKPGTKPCPPFLPLRRRVKDSVRLLGPPPGHAASGFTDNTLINNTKNLFSVFIFFWHDSCSIEIILPLKHTISKKAFWVAPKRPFSFGLASVAAVLQKTSVSAASPDSASPRPPRKPLLHHFRGPAPRSLAGIKFYTHPIRPSAPSSKSGVSGETLRCAIC